MDAAALSADVKPRLPRGVRLRRDQTRQQWQLLAPERVLQLDAVAAEVLQRCTGTATLGEIVDDLAVAFKGDRIQIDRDVRAMLTMLADKKVLDL